MASLRNYTLKIKNGEKVEFGLRGNVVRLVSSSFPIFFASRDDDINFYLEQGEQAVLKNGEKFTQLDISHTQGAEQTIILAIGEDAEIGSAKVSGAVTVTSLTPSRTTGANTNPAVTNASTQLVAVNASRNYLLIQNKDAVGNIYINFGAAATVANGIKIPPSGSFELNCNVLTAVINAIGDIANNTNIVVVTG
jgi:hypothetical protein